MSMRVMRWKRWKKVKNVLLLIEVDSTYCGLKTVDGTQYTGTQSPLSRVNYNTSTMGATFGSLHPDLP